ncbi:MAG: hypothetical protein U0836_22130 [Pirellulales bacterium]
MARADLEQIAGCGPLRTLNVSESLLRAGDFVSLAKLKQLETLDLSSTLISDASVDTLAYCQSLRTLDVSFTRIIAVGANTLQRRVPGCSVLWAPRLAPGPQENSVR